MRHGQLLGLGKSGFHRIAYTDWGDATHPHVVVCVHGLTRNGRDFDALARALASRCRVVCPDMPGRGASDWLPDPAEYGYPQYLADSTALLARVSVHATTIDWVGTSMGGLIGMMLACRAGSPIRRLVMNDVGPVLAREGLTRIGSYAGADPAFESFDAFAAHLRTVLRPWGDLSDVQWRTLAEHSARRRDDGRWGFHYDPAIAAGFRGRVFDRDVEMWDLWDQVSCPALLLRGRDSELFRADTARRMCERAAPTRLVEFEGVGHAPSLMVADQIEPIVRFLLEDPA